MQRAESEFSFQMIFPIDMASVKIVNDNPLINREWIRRNSLRPEVIRYGDPVEVRDIILAGASPSEIVIR